MIVFSFFNKLKRKLALLISFFYLLLSFSISFSQSDCNFKLSGEIIALNSINELIPFASVQLVEVNKQVLSDAYGQFNFDAICAGTYHLKVTEIGYNILDTSIVIKKNKHLLISLTPNQQVLNETVVVVQKQRASEVVSLQKDEISGIELDKVRGLSLGESLKQITGVTSVQTGPNISKPMIHGLYGNRVLVMNNGVRLEGQNWGSDHAPEVDPFIATKLTVIKGSAGIRYGSDAIGGVVLVDPKDMSTTKGIQGEVNLVGASNGKSGTSSTYLEGAFGKKLTGLSWRIQGTLKKAGASKTPDYYLTNSGMQESNYSGALAYKRKQLELELYYSSFNTKIGIYSGSQVGNLQDLLTTFASSEPIVPSVFSYKIDRGYQTVIHNTFKAKGAYYFKKAGKLTYTFAQQTNKRSEFGVDISYNPTIVAQNIPDAYFQLKTNTSDLVWEHKTLGHFSGSIGVNFITQGNVYKGLDYRALIPNFRSYGGGIFAMEKWKHHKISLEAGLRYDYKWMRTYQENYQTLGTYSVDYNWGNISGIAGMVYDFNNHYSLHASFGTGWRPPSPIELFAMGIHQSAASFEIGDTTLKREHSYNTQVYFNYDFKRFHGEIGTYFNYFDNYIYQNPLPNPVVTIAGTYPAFQYKQAVVFYTGLDANLRFDITSFLTFTSKTTLIFAYNRTIHDYLIYVPGNRFDNGLSFNWKQIWKLKQCYFDVSALVVSQQRNAPKNTDYVPPPKGYTLLNASIGFSIPVKNQVIGISLTVSNILNTRYRDYLNRFRYYANEIGRNFTLRVRIPFVIFKSNKNNNI